MQDRSDVEICRPPCDAHSMGPGTRFSPFDIPAHTSRESDASPARSASAPVSCGHELSFSSIVALMARGSLSKRTRGARDARLYASTDRLGPQAGHLALLIGSESVTLSFASHPACFFSLRRRVVAARLPACHSSAVAPPARPSSVIFLFNTTISDFTPVASRPSPSPCSRTLSRSKKGHEVGASILASGLSGPEQKYPSVVLRRVVPVGRTNTRSSSTRSDCRRCGEDPVDGVAIHMTLLEERDMASSHRERAGEPTQERSNRGRRLRRATTATATTIAGRLESLRQICHDSRLCSAVTTHERTSAPTEDGDRAFIRTPTTC